MAASRKDYHGDVFKAAWGGFVQTGGKRVGWGLLVSVVAAVIGALNGGVPGALIGGAGAILISGLLVFLWWLLWATPADKHAAQEKKIQELEAAGSAPRLEVKCLPVFTVLGVPKEGSDVRDFFLVFSSVMVCNCEATVDLALGVQLRITYAEGGHIQVNPMREPLAIWEKLKERNPAISEPPLAFPLNLPHGEARQGYIAFPLGREGRSAELKVLAGISTVTLPTSLVFSDLRNNRPLTTMEFSLERRDLFPSP